MTTSTTNIWTLLDERVTNLAIDLGVTEEKINEVFARLYHDSPRRSHNGAVIDAYNLLPAACCDLLR